MEREENIESSEQKKTSTYNAFVERHQKKIQRFWIYAMIVFFALYLTLTTITNISRIVMGCSGVILMGTTYVIWVLRTFEFKDPAEWKGLFYHYMAGMIFAAATLIGYVVYLTSYSI